MTYTIDYAIISGKWGDIMSYETDVMRNLTLALRENNKNIEVLKYLSLELRRANELKEIELGLRKVEDYSFNQNNQKKKINKHLLFFKKEDNMHKIIVITGPTAVGKTKLSIELAKKYDGEIINADAVQVYKGLDIGSAKVTEEEKEGIPHHLLDFKEVTEEYTIYHYQKDCREKIKDIQSRNKTPILVGGTGLYIKAALYDYKLSEEKSTNTYDNLTNEELYEELKKLDKDIIIDKDNRRRLIRAINYYKENNESINKNKTNKLLYNVIFIGLTTDRQVLYDKINKRVDEMISQGLLEEVKSFYDKGIKSKPLLNAIGYRELYNYLDGNCTKEEAIEKIKQNSRHYAKRQYTFFNHQLPVVWFETDYNNFNNTIEKVASYIDSN